MRPSRVPVIAAALTLGAALSALPAQKASAQPPSTQVLVPSSGATVSGTKVVLDAGASGGTTQVQFELTGGSLSDTVIATATPTYYGWIALWNSTRFLDGTYTLQSIATEGGSSTTSPGVSITVSNGSPSVSIVVPSSGGTVSGNPAVIDAVASPGVSQVTFTLAVSVAPPPCTYVPIPNSPGFYVCTIAAVPTIYGWIGTFDSTQWANGSYPLFTMAKYPNGQGSAPVMSSVEVDNQAQPTVVVPSSGATVSGTQVLDCVVPSGTGAPVSFIITGTGGGQLDDATLTNYGWLYEWNTKGGANGQYSLTCDATYTFGGSGSGPSISVTVSN